MDGIDYGIDYGLDYSMETIILHKYDVITT